ncbi:unnamed protein product, partial [Clonostachys solani]
IVASNLRLHSIPSAESRKMKLDEPSAILAARARSVLAQIQQQASVTRALLIGFLIYLIINRIQYIRKTPKVASVGFPPIPFIDSYVAAIRFLLNPVKLVKEGSAKSKNGMFRIATLQGEYVLVTDRRKVAEYIKAPDSVLNMQDGSNDQQQIPYTMGYGVGYRTYHTSVVRGVLTKELGINTPKMLNEASLALDDLIGSPEDYTPIGLYDILAMTVARVSSRVYVGTEFCRNQEYLKNAADYAQAVVISAEILRLFPEFMKSFVTQLLPVMKYRRTGAKFLHQYIQDRLDGKLDEDGQKPHDLVQWLIDAAPPVEKTVPQLAERVMALNVASIHTTTMVFSGALYSLAMEPERYLEPLRQEVLDNLEDDEITPAMLGKLHKMDSFLRESGRFNNAGLMAMQRNVKREFRFSDGTVLPPGSKVGAPSFILHRDPEVYDDPEIFDGFRFIGSKYQDSKETLVVNTTNNYHVFGHGRHPCPGRFFAVHEMKLIFCLLLLKYDIKLAPGDVPRGIFIATMAIPDTRLKVQFKARKE